MSKDITYEKACKIAYKEFIKKQYKKGLCLAGEVEDGWLFGANMFHDAPAYGAVLLYVHKNGEYEDFNQFMDENWEIYDSSTLLEIPEQFRYVRPKNI